MTTKTILAFCLGLILGFAGGYIFTDLHYRSMEIQSPVPAAGAEGMASGASGSPSQGMGAMPDAHEKLRALEKRVQDNPKDVQTLVALANLYYDISQFEKAIPYYERALAEKPGDPNVQTDLGYCYFETGQTAKALEHYDQASAADPTHFQSVLNALVATIQEKDLRRAQGYLDRLKKLNPPGVDLKALEAEVVKLGKP